MTKTTKALFTCAMLANFLFCSHAAAVTLPKDSHYLYVGGGINDHKYLHATLTTPTSIGNFYSRIGTFHKGADDIAYQVGYKYPYKLTGKNNNGFYIGLFGGHVEPSQKDKKPYNRLGVGADFGYSVFDTYRLGGISLGLYFGEPIKQADGTYNQIEPNVFTTIDFSVGLF